MKIKPIALFLLALTLTSCGFRLRDRNILPPEMKEVYLASKTPYGKFEQSLRNTLLSVNAKIVDTPQDSPATIKIISKNFYHDSPDITPNTHQAVYTFTYLVSFALLGKNNRIILLAQTISATRKLALNPNQQFENTPETDFIKQEMTRSLIFQIQNILNSRKVRRTLAKEYGNKTLPNTHNKR